MHEETLHSPPDPSMRHEPTDIETRPLKITALVFLLAMIVIPLALLLLYAHYRDTATHPDRKESMLEDEDKKDAAPTAPEPRIQGVPKFHGPVPRADMEQLRHESEQRLHSYGKSEDQGYVRIPIDRAMQILADGKMKPTTQKSR